MRKVKSSSLATEVSNLGERQSLKLYMGQVMEEKGAMYSSLTHMQRLTVVFFLLYGLRSPLVGLHSQAQKIHPYGH